MFSVAQRLFSPDFMSRMKHLHLPLRVLLLIAAALPLALTAAPLELKQGDHIALVGGGLPDRMQHHGWLETLIYAKYPKHNLVFRNLSAAGDEVATWHRSENFGTREDWLKKT